MKVVVVAKVIKSPILKSGNLYYSRVKLTNGSLLDVYSDNPDTFKPLFYLFKPNNVLAIELEIKNFQLKNSYAKFVYHALVKAEVITRSEAKTISEEEINEALRLSPYYL